MSRRFWIGSTLAVILLAVIVGGVAIATNGDHTFYACENNGRVIADSIRVDEPVTCKGNKTMVRWNSDGPPGAEVRVPDGEGPFPAIVLVHGGGWLRGSPSFMRSLATFLSDRGFLTVNTPYKLSNQSPGFPQAVDDVACAVKYAVAHPDSDGTVALIGHSAGAHISAIVALTGDQYGADCPVPGTGIPDRFVGLAGPYDVNRLGIIMLPFFGAGPNETPDAWLAGNPQRLTDENPDLVSLVMYGGSDGSVDSQYAADFHRALTASGSESLVEGGEDALHTEMRDPAWVGDLIVVWLER